MRRRPCGSAWSTSAGKPFGDSRKVVMTCAPENVPAMYLYRGLGFRETGNADEDEIELALMLP